MMTPLKVTSSRWLQKQITAPLRLHCHPSRLTWINHELIISYQYSQNFTSIIINLISRHKYYHDFQFHLWNHTFGPDKVADTLQKTFSNAFLNENVLNFKLNFIKMYVWWFDWHVSIGSGISVMAWSWTVNLSPPGQNGRHTGRRQFQMHFLE